MNRCAAIVVEVTSAHVWVEVPARVQACANCPTPGACQTGLLGLANRPRRYRLDNELELCVGDHVNLVMAQGRLWRAALASYLMPVLLAIAGAAIGQWWAGDAGAVAGMFSGLWLGFVLLRRHVVHAHHAHSLLSLQHHCSQAPLSKSIIKETS